MSIDYHSRQPMPAAETGHPDCEVLGVSECYHDGITGGTQADFKPWFRALRQSVHCGRVSPSLSGHRMDARQRQACDSHRPTAQPTRFLTPAHEEVPVSSLPVRWPSSRPRWITPHDACRSYRLHDDVECNIPRRGYPGGFGAHD